MSKIKDIVLLSFFAFCVTLKGAGQKQASIPLLRIAPNIKRIVFLGNSITWLGNYVNDIETYITARYPERTFEFINVGLPSETVSGLSETGHAGGAFPRPDLHERLKRVLDQTKPDLVFACYGINDGIYLPFNDQRFQKFKDGIDWMHNEIVKTGAKIIHLTPPNYDELKGKSMGYTKVMSRYANWLLGLRSTAKWNIIDIYHPMQEYLEAHRKVDKKFHEDGFALAADGIHPYAVGHWIIAKQILIYLGCKEVFQATGILQSLSDLPNAERILKLVTARQNMMRDAWLTATKYNRPGLPEGLSLPEAKLMSKEKAFEINALVLQKKIAEVYLLGGQSNATGQGYLCNMTDTMKINQQVMIFHSGSPHLNSGLAAFTWQPMHQASESPDRFGPEMGFSSNIRSINTDAQIALIKHAHSGSNLYEEWYPGDHENDTSNWGVHFKEFVQVVYAGLDSLRKRGYVPIIKGMLWQQGEAEAFSKDSISIQYGILLVHFIQRVRDQFQAPSMPFVYGHVCPPPLNSPGIRTVREAQRDVDQYSGMALSVNGACLVPTDDLSRRAADRNTAYPNDQLHFGTDGTWVLGLRMAQAMNAASSNK